ncbi:mucin-5AC-like [Mizuhopecten yessoensis]|uniref:mucin-5AC-like n=1 Tax=Mizuhopecten yessoensis TaxID=6573 RepID=UPI000B45BA58|nr:mucin-5AC-like [Mizuhopecten yessoensis]
MAGTGQPLRIPTTTQISKSPRNIPQGSSTKNLQGNPTSAVSQPYLIVRTLNTDQRRKPPQSTSANQINNSNTSKLRAAKQINPSPRRLRMNTQDLKGQKSINVRKNIGRPFQQNSQRASLIIPPVVKINRNQGRQLSKASSRNNFAQVSGNRNQNVRITNNQNTQREIALSRGQMIRRTGQSVAMLKRGARTGQLPNQIVRKIQTKRVPSNVGTTRVLRGRGSFIRGQSSIKGPLRNSGSLRSSSMVQRHTSNRGEFKQGATNQIRILTQTDTSKLPMKGINRKIPIMTQNTERGMWKNVPVAPGSVPLDQLKSNQGNIQKQVYSNSVIHSKPLINQGRAATSLANSKNRISSTQTAPNGRTVIGGSGVLGSSSAGIATNNAKSGVGVVQSHAPNGTISLELNLKAPNTQTAVNVNNVQPVTGLTTGNSINSGVATSGLAIVSSSAGGATSTNAASGQVLQIQKVHSGMTSNGKKKMSLTLSSGKSGGQPIVIEALGNIILSQEKLPDGRVQFVIKTDTPTSVPTVKSTIPSTTATPTTTVTTATSTVTIPLTTTTAILPTTTVTLPTSTIFLEETEMPEPGEFTPPPSGLGTTEPM